MLYHGFSISIALWDCWKFCLASQPLSHFLLRFSAYWLVLLTNLQQLLGEIWFRLLGSLLYAYILFTQGPEALVTLNSLSTTVGFKNNPSVSLFLSNNCMFNFPASCKMMKPLLEIIYAIFPIDKVQNPKAKSLVRNNKKELFYYVKTCLLWFLTDLSLK